MQSEFVYTKMGRWTFHFFSFSSCFVSSVPQSPLPPTLPRSPQWQIKLSSLLSKRTNDRVQLEWFYPFLFLFFFFVLSNWKFFLFFEFVPHLRWTFFIFLAGALIILLHRYISVIYTRISLSTIFSVGCFVSSFVKTNFDVFFFAMIWFLMSLFERRRWPHEFRQAFYDSYVVALQLFPWFHVSNWRFIITGIITPFVTHIHTHTHM